MHSQDNKQKLIEAFEYHLAQEVPYLDHPSKMVWEKGLDSRNKFYITLDVPSSAKYGESVGVNYGIAPVATKIVAGAYYNNQMEVKFPFKLHREIFAFFDPPLMRKVSYFWWLNVSYRKKLLYGNKGLTEYSANQLVPYAVKKVGFEYRKYSRK